MNADDRRYFESMLKTITQSVDNLKDDVSELKNDMKRYSEKVTVLEKNELSHGKGCPQNVELGGVVKRVSDIEKDLEEYRVAKKYPKLMLVLVFVLAAGMVAYSFITLEKVGKIAEKYGISQTSAQTNQ